MTMEELGASGYKVASLTVTSTIGCCPNFCPSPRPHWTLPLIGCN